MDAADNFPKLTVINLSSNGITYEGVKALVAAAGNLPNLAEIDIGHNRITCQGVIDLLNNFPNLKKIGLRQICSEEYKLVGNEVLMAIVALSGNFPNLTDINLSGAYFSV